MAKQEIDTLECSQKLEQMGFPREQAEGLVTILFGIITSTLISKGDIGEIELKIEQVKAELKRDIKHLDLKVESVKTELKRDIKHLDLKVESVKTELKRDMAELKRDIRSTEDRMGLKMTINMGSFAILILGAIVALAKLGLLTPMA